MSQNNVQIRKGQVKVGIIGCGEMGAMHAACLNQIERVKLIGVCDTDRVKANALGEQYGVAVYSHYKDLIEQDKIESIYICTRPTSHKKLIDYALKNNRHVFCEKPLVPSPQDIYSLVPRIKENKAKFMIGFNHRWAPVVCKAKEVMKKYNFRPLIADFIFSFPHFLHGHQGTVEEGGILQSLGVHIFDLVRHLLEDEISCGFCFLGRLRLKDPYTDDSAVAVVRLDKNPTLVTLNFHDHCSPSYIEEKGRTVHVELFGSDGVIKIENLTTLTAHFDKSTASFNVGPYDRMHSWGYFAEDNHFINCILRGVEPTPSFRDAVLATLWIDALKQSALKNKIFTLCKHELILNEMQLLHKY